jgi:hypothetical protein
MAAEEHPALRMPRDVAEAREVIARAFGLPADKVAEHFGLDDMSFADVSSRAMSRSRDQRGPFLYYWSSVLAERELKQRAELQEQRAARDTLDENRRLIDILLARQASVVPDQPTTAPEATPVTNQTDDTLAALGREVSGVDAKVKILLGLASLLLAGVIGGAITLWQAIGGVETRLARELGQTETRIVQQIADVRSEVGEIRGRLSVLGEGPAPRQ